jgi:hypothetical protein
VTSPTDLRGAVSYTKVTVVAWSRRGPDGLGSLFHLFIHLRMSASSHTLDGHTGKDMSSDIVPDILNGLVAAGTLALAGSTVLLGRATSKTRIDANSPRMFVSWLVVDELRAGSGGKSRIPPGSPWVMAQNGQDRVGLHASGRLRNDSTVTALFRFELGTNCEITSLTRPHENPYGGGDQWVSLQPREGWYGIRPDGAARFEIIWWQSAQTWAAAWPGRASGSESAGSPPVTTTRLVVRGAVGEAVDRCDLTFGGFAFIPQPGEDSWVTAIPGTAPEPVVSIGLMRRAYRLAWRRP